MPKRLFLIFVTVLSFFNLSSCSWLSLHSSNSNTEKSSYETLSLDPLNWKFHYPTHWQLHQHSPLFDQASELNEKNTVERLSTLGSPLLTFTSKQQDDQQETEKQDITIIVSAIPVKPGPFHNDSQWLVRQASYLQHAYTGFTMTQPETQISSLKQPWTVIRFSFVDDTLPASGKVNSAFIGKWVKSSDQPIGIIIALADPSGKNQLSPKLIEESLNLFQSN